METATPASELERRKQIRLRLRRDLVIEAQKYEGRTFHVVKDPVSLRYYRLKDNEYFLLQYLDGKHTLEEAQKEYEVRYRPDRLKLEDVEAFGQQLINAGLAQNESPRAGKQLYEQRKKRRRSEWMQTLTNILYIKIPVFDPDWLLKRMLRWVGFIFTLSFFLLSVGLMLSAALLVATHFETFRSKLPEQHMFFRFQTIAYMWAALGAVKIIHEFGHGLSCKTFGGEVHEMGALLLCLSPALYCNVSDAWTLPNKWHRIIISAAGIYVELVIASIATFVWWNSAPYPFINNLALSLMVVCSISTVVFNANPLMRYDGYYVLADWLEIPNLRERSNRFLKNLMLEHCLGVEVTPEPYMALWRRILFVSYAVGSYVYRWVVTFSILWFLYSFLRPYKLEVISQMLALGAAASMAGWPLYRLGKSIYKRGRIPDMKKWRVLASTTVLTALVLFAVLVPVPVSRIRGHALVLADPSDTGKVYVRHPGILTKLNIRPGDYVEAGEVLAEFRDPDLDAELLKTVSEREDAHWRVKTLQHKLHEITDPGEKRKITEKRSAENTKYHEAKELVKTLEGIRDEDLKLRAPCSGTIGVAPSIEDVTRLFQEDPLNPFCTINNPGRVRVCMPLITPDYNRLRQDLEQLSPAATRTRRLMKHRITVSYDNTRLADVLADLKKQIKDLQWTLDTEAGANEDLTVSYQAKEQRLGMVLDALFGRMGLGFVILSESDSKQDGHLLIRPGSERGEPEGGRPLVDLDVIIRIKGRDSQTWKGKIRQLPESEAKTVPPMLSNHQGGPVAVKTAPNSEKQLVPTTQQYLVYLEIVDADESIVPGTAAQVKIYCQPETCVHWVWRWLNETFDLGLI
ncbi:MAG TPA: biotin/lipoyl-binding protein [Gemmataceae bacterium]|nr:biotin/lipoyl-binding protein [Gemmataceae bacterium]